MTDYLSLLRNDLIKGYSKSDLERLIGLPRNCLSGILKGDKKLSKKSEVKIGIWEASEKPNPITLEKVKKQVKENNKPDNKENILEERKGVNTTKIAKRKNPLTPEETIEPTKGSLAHFLKYGK